MEKQEPVSGEGLAELELHPTEVVSCAVAVPVPGTAMKMALISFKSGDKRKDDDVCNLMPRK